MISSTTSAGSQADGVGECKDLAMVWDLMGEWTISCFPDAFICEPNKASRRVSVSQRS